MIDENISDDQQAEEVKKWWRENGSSIIFGVVIGLAGVFGWQQWQEHQANRMSTASLIFEQVVAKLEVKDIAAAKQEQSILSSEYSDTPYATQAALRMAKNYVVNNEYQLAKNSLRWVMQNSADQGLQQIAKLRLAKVLLAKENSSEALSLVNNYQGAFVAEYAEVRGDALLATGKLSEARAAYQLALVSSAPVSENRILLQMKIDDLAGAAE